MYKVQLYVLLLACGVLFLLNGCSEDSGVGPKNQNPVISSVTCTCDSVLLGETSQISVIASDPDGDPLTYTYTATAGSVLGNGNTAIFTAGNTPGNATVDITVSDGNGGEDKSSTSFIMHLRAKDGAWQGSTNQGRNISFTVINHGTQIDSGLTITIVCSEYWGTATITITRTVPLSITDNKFSWSGSSFTVNGTFETTSHCSGNFSISGNTGYPSYLPYSASGTWTTDWISESGESIKSPAVEQPIEKEKRSSVVKKMANARVKILYGVTK